MAWPKKKSSPRRSFPDGNGCPRQSLRDEDRATPIASPSDHRRRDHDAGCLQPGAGVLRRATAGRRLGRSGDRQPDGPDRGRRAGRSGVVGPADRLTSATYTPDTTAAMIAGLARSGIATFSDPANSILEQPVGTAASPFELLDFQTHALAVGAWAGSTWSGAELDAVLSVPTGLPDAARASVLLASYVAAVDSPGAALSRALMAGQDLAQPSTLRFFRCCPCLVPNVGRARTGAPAAKTILPWCWATIRPTGIRRRVTRLSRLSRLAGDG